jgi:hypothetical protein
MSTQLSTHHGASYVLRRVAARAGLGIWRHRVAVLIGGIAVVGLGTYATSNVATSSGALPVMIAGSSGTDCADTAMAMIADKSTDAASRAYQCMDAGFQQRVPEAQFVQQMQRQTVPNVQKLQRVGDYHSAAGGTMVYYAVDGDSQSVGYIVYLGQNGKVLRIE